MHLPLVQQAANDRSHRLSEDELLLQNLGVTFYEYCDPILLGQKNRAGTMIRVDLRAEVGQERHRFFFRKREIPANSHGPVTRRPARGSLAFLENKVHGDAQAA